MVKQYLFKDKYNAKKCIVNGKKFASHKEGDRYKVLLQMQKDKEISDLELQKPFVLQEGVVRRGEKIRPITYVCDFYYWDPKEEAYIVEDVKGIRTRDYQIKKKMFKAKYGECYIHKET